MDGCVAVAEAEAEAVAVAVCTVHIFPVCTIHIFLFAQCTFSYLHNAQCSLAASRRGHFFDIFLTFSELFQECFREVWASSKGVPATF